MSLGRHGVQTCICSLIVFNSFFVLYLMCCFGSNPLYMDFTPIQIMFYSVLRTRLNAKDLIECLSQARTWISNVTM